MATITLQSSINLPSAATSVSFGSKELFVGSDDGAVRLYQLPSTKVFKAIKCGRAEVSSVISGRSEEIWVAHGCYASCFHVDSPKIILTGQDVDIVLELGEDNEDVLNELSLSENKKYLAFSTDSGTVGIVDLSTRIVSRMKTRHNSICGAVSFVPDRPNELVSGGYDSALLHFDFLQGTLLSRFGITAPPLESGISLSPPFVLSVAVSTSGLLATGTADGRVWLGGGGEKLSAGSKKKRSRKWEGLREDGGLWIQVTQGPMVAVVFANPATLIVCTLLGSLKQYIVSRDVDGKLQIKVSWSAETKGMAKVNAMAVKDGYVVVGGISKGGKGLVETWESTTLNTVQETAK